MAGPYNSSLTRVQPFFELLFRTDEGGLSALLAAAPRARAALGDLVESPGEILSVVLGPHPKGKAPRACFEYEVPPLATFLRWCVQHPEKLRWPQGKTYSPDTTIKRRALLYDEPPGRSAAQHEALRKIGGPSPSKPPWWRFEGSSWIDCVLMTDRLVVTIEGKRTEQLSASTDWYPQRSQLVRNLEAARQLARGRAWATLLLSETPMLEGDPAEVAASLDAGAPHVNDAERAALQNAYLGNLTWVQACEATGVPFEVLPDTTTGSASAGPGG